MEQCGKCGRCAGVKRVTARLSRHFACIKFAGNIEEVLEQEETLCDEVETVMEFTYVGDSVSVDESVRLL